MCNADGFPDYIKEVEFRGNKFDILIFSTSNPLKDALPKVKFPEAKSVIVLVWDYYRCEYPESLKKMIGKAYLGRGYNPKPGSITHARQQLMIDYLTAGGCKVRSDIGLPAIWAGAAAGVTAFGKKICVLWRCGFICNLDLLNTKHKDPHQTSDTAGNIPLENNYFFRFEKEMK